MEPFTGSRRNTEPDLYGNPGARAPDPGAPLNVLLVEDDPGDALLVCSSLKQIHGRTFQIAQARNLAEALDRISHGESDVVLLDLTLPDSAGLDTFAKVYSHAPHLPVVVLTGVSDETIAIAAVRQGAQDYLIKLHTDGATLGRSIVYAVERARILLELEQTRREQERVKDQFLSHVSHELRMPLAVIHQAMFNMLNGAAGEVNADQRECLEIALPNLRQLQKMINELLQATRSEGPGLQVETETVSLDRLLARIVASSKTIAKSKGIVVDGPICPGPLSVDADPMLIEEVLQNLIDNALKYTPGGGEIRVRAQTWEKDPKWVCVSITDTGCGIAPDARERIFQRFNQAYQPVESSRKGLGLGLYICRQIIAAHGGRIWVDSVPGEGSTFSFTLPSVAGREQGETNHA